MVRITAAGTAYRLAPTAEGVPSPDVERVIDAATRAVNSSHAELFVADWNHGDVETEGAWSLALEGDYEWPFRVNRDRIPASVHVEVGTGWRLDVYPAA